MAARSKAAPAALPAPAGSNFPVIKDKAAVAAAEEYFGLTKEETRIRLRKKELKRLLVAAMGGAPTAFAGARVLTLNEVADVPGTPDRTITKDMVGQVIPGSSGTAGYTKLGVK